MKICPITYAPFEENGKYSRQGLRLVSPRLSQLKDIPYTAAEQRQEAVARADKMSFQGLQLKLSARLDVPHMSFVFVNTGGRFIIKPQSALYPQLPENEDLTMRLAAAAAVEVPLHGLLFASDGSLSYFIKRFDRTGRKYKLPVEDFAQLLGRDRDTKYDSSMEQVADVIMQFCTFPVLEAVKLLRIVLVNYLLGNEDGHLKNFSLITRDQKVELSPAYDLVNSSIAIANPTEEIALPIRGRKRNLSRSLFLNYFAGERLGLNSTSIEAVLREISVAFAQWDRLISNSFLSQAKKKSFLDLLLTRKAVLGF